MGEQWKAVVGHEGIYEVSNQGRVKRIKGGTGNAKAGRILRPYKNRGGYLRVDLSKKGTRHAFLVSRLVLMAFKGMPKSGQESNHKNGIKADNYPDNLEWLTRSENMIHKCRVLGYRGEIHGMAKLKNHDIPVIRRLLAEGKLLQREIGKLFGVAAVTISSLKNGKSWIHV